MPSLLTHAVSSGLEARDFSIDSHRRIFSRLRDLGDTERPIDLVSLIEELTRHDELALVGDVGYVSGLIDGAVPERAHVLYQVDIIRQKALLRRAIAVLEQAQYIAAQPNADPQQVINASTERLQKLLTDKPR